jgi:protein-tyrosine-phosphatase
MPRRIVFVCTGNTCRSPLAEVLARARYADLPLNFASAGTDAVAGQPAAAEARAVARERGLDLECHRAVRLDAASLADALWVIGMTRAQVAVLRARLTAAWPGRVGLLGAPGHDWRQGGVAPGFAPTGGADVPDPWRQPADRYREVAGLIDGRLAAWHDVFREIGSGKDCLE